MTRSYETFVLQLLKLFLAFPKVLDDMETSRLASLQEPSLRETQLIIAVVIDKSSKNTLIKSRTTEIPLNFDSTILVFNLRFSRLLEYVHHEPEVSHYLPM
ncbi:hypothetical protein Tco_0430174, partial [Tanacetum coccineum]